VKEGRPNYISYSTVLNNKEQKKAAEDPGFMKPLKNCLEQFEMLENKHQIISKLTTKFNQQNSNN
jgi:hypothetical protein